MTERQAALILLLSRGVGPVAAARMRGKFGSYAAAVGAAMDPGAGSCLPSALSTAIRTCVTERTWLAEMEAADRARARFAVPGDDDYPGVLAQTASAPIGIFVAGGALNEMEPMIGVVGTRTPTPRGTAVASGLAADLGRAGLTVVSGLARGIDTAAHEGALEAGAPTVAVLGCGISRIYPPENAGLALEIARNGALVSEFPMTTEPRAGFFPRRNRIIAGLSAGTIVVEAGERSGALITAARALEEGREVFAVPGPVDEPLSKGPNGLIKSGAGLVEDARDVIDDIETAWGPLRPRGNPDARSHDDAAVRTRGHSLARDVDAPGPGAQPREDDDGSTVLACLSLTPLTPDDLVLRSGLPVSRVLAALMLLELSGRAACIPGGRFVLTSSRGGGRRGGM